MLCLCSAPLGLSFILPLCGINRAHLVDPKKRASSFIYVFLRRWRNSYAPIAHVSVQACIRIGNIELSNNKKMRILVFYCLLRVQPAISLITLSLRQESEIAWHNRRRGATCHPPLSGVKGDWPDGIELGITHSATFFVRSYVTYLSFQWRRPRLCVPIYKLA